MFENLTNKQLNIIFFTYYFICAVTIIPIMDGIKDYQNRPRTQWSLASAGAVMLISPIIMPILPVGVGFYFAFETCVKNCKED